MNIFIESSVLLKEQQGSRRYLLELYKAVLELDQSIRLIIGSKDKPLDDFGNSNRVVYESYKFSSRLLVELIDIPRIVKKHKCNYAHFQYFSFYFSKKCKTIVTIHDLLFISHKDHFPFSYVLSRSIVFFISSIFKYKILTVSDYSKQMIHKYFKTPYKKIIITPNGVNKSFFIENNLPVSNRKIILCLSRFEPRKNQHLVLRLFNELNLYEHGYYLYFIGTKTLQYNDWYNELEKTPPSALEKIIQQENCSQDTLLHILKNTRLSFYLSNAEGFGIPPLESAAAQVPVICSKLTAMSEFTSLFGKNCIDPNDWKNLKKITSDEIFKSKRDYDIKKTALIISDKYTWNKSAAVLISLFKEME